MHWLGGWPLHRGRHRSICLHGLIDSVLIRTYPVP
jgi:hypothetical protein